MLPPLFAAQFEEFDYLSEVYAGRFLMGLMVVFVFLLVLKMCAHRQKSIKRKIPNSIEIVVLIVCKTKEKSLCLIPGIVLFVCLFLILDMAMGCRGVSWLSSSVLQRVGL